MNERLEALAELAPEEVLVSSTVKNLVAGSDIEFEDRGEYELKGVPATRPMDSVVARRTR
jgi:class 3 adenylate cyclase